MANELSFTVTLDNRQMLDAAKKIEAAFKNMNSTAQSEGQKMDATLRKIGGMVGAYFSVQAMQQFAVKVATVRGQFQQLEAAFKTLIGSERTANALMSQLMDTAAKTPFGMTDIAQSAKQLLAYGVAAEDVNKTLIRLGDIAAGLSIPIGDLAYLYGTTMVQGRLYTQDLNQFVGRGIPLTGELAKQFNVAESEVRKLVEEGRVGFPEVQKAIEALTGEGGKFGGLMDAQSRTITGQISNIEDSIEQMFNELGKQSEGAINSALDAALWAVEHWEALGKAVMTAVSALGAYKAAVVVVNAVHKAGAIIEMTKGLTGMARAAAAAKSAMQALNIAMKANPWGLAASLIAAAASALWLFIDGTEEASEETQLYGKEADNAVKRLETLGDVINATAADSKVHKDAINEVNGILQDYNTELIDEKDNLEEVNRKRQQAIDLIKQEGIARQLADKTAAANERYSQSASEAESDFKDDFAGDILDAHSFSPGNRKYYKDKISKEAETALPIIQSLVEADIDNLVGKKGDEYEAAINELKKRVDTALRSIGITSFGFEDLFVQNSNGWGKTKIYDASVMNKRFDEYVGALVKGKRDLKKETDDIRKIREDYDVAMSSITPGSGEANKEEEKAISLLEARKQALENLAAAQKNLAAIEANPGGKTGEEYQTAVAAVKAAEDAAKKLGIDLDAATKKENEQLEKAAEQTARLQGEIAQAAIDAMKDGTAKKIAQIELDTRQQLAALEQQKKELMEAQGGTLTDEQAEVITVRRTQITESGEQAKTQVRMDEAERLQAEFDAALEQYGDYYAKRQQIISQGEAEIAEFMAQFGDMQGADAIAANMQKQINETLGKLSLENLKANLDWDAIFGDVGGQSTAALKTALEQVRTLLATSTESMTTEEIQLLTEAMDEIEGELESRNPFLGLAGALGGLKAERKALIPLLQEQAAAESELAEAQLAQQQADLEYKEAAAAYADNEDAETLQAKIAAETNLAAATDKVAKSQEKYNTATTKVGKQQNKVNQELKSATSNFRSVGSSVTGIGDQVAELAGIFDDELGDSIGSAMDIIDSMISGVTSVIDTIANAGLGAVSTISETVNASSTGMQAASAAGAASISAMEKASVILAVISAALQIATAIASAINPDAAAEERIEKLTADVEQLRWEASHIELKIIEENTGMGAEKLMEMYGEARETIMGENSATMKQLNALEQGANKALAATIIGAVTANAQMGAAGIESYIKLKKEADDLRNSLNDKVIEEAQGRIKQGFLEMGYAADQSFGDDKFNTYSAQLDNISKQAVDQAQMIEEEQSKKNPDEEKLQEYQNQLAETSGEAAEIINSMTEDLFGDDIEGLANTLADAFFDAFKNGEDAAKAWGDAVNDIVSDIVKNLMVNEVLGGNMKTIMEKYRSQFYAEDGTFLGYENAMSLIPSLAADLQAERENFQEEWDNLDEQTKEMLAGNEDTRSATAKGIATASQESVDENNARLTTIQGHTYLLMTGMQELNRTAASALEHLAGIESNTERLIAMDTNIQRLRTSISNMETQGLKLRT